MQSALDEVFRAVVAEEVRKGVEEIRRELRQSLGSERQAWLTQKEAAQLARVTPRTIREWQASGKLRRCGMGRALVDRAELEALLRAGNEAQEGHADLAEKVTSILASAGKR